MMRTKMLNSGRRKGAVGSKPTVVTNWVYWNVDPEARILDWGAGKFQQQADILRSGGFDIIDCWDLEENMEGWSRKGLNHQSYDCVMLSNVLNVQPTIEDMTELLETVWPLVAAGGVLVVNYPASPRYSSVPFNKVRHLVERACLHPSYRFGQYGITCKKEEM